MKTLICINTCNRLTEVQKYIWAYIDFCNKNEGFEFLLALDGKEQAYIDFCNEYEIPLIFSEEREGVGLSKNRVLKKFPEFDYYFFIDDDVELVDPRIFSDFILISRIRDCHHASANFPREIAKTESINGFLLEYAKYGGAYFNFFTGEGLKKVGGWNLCFAKYKRYGHTEHTYRYYHAGLSEAPFVSLVNARKKLILHNPPHVTNDASDVDPLSQLIQEEQELINQKTTFFPVTTLSDFYFNGFSMSFNKKANEFLKKNKRRYPLTKGKVRRIALAEHYFLRIKTTRNILKKCTFLMISVLYNPINKPFKHYIKKLFANY